MITITGLGVAGFTEIIGPAMEVYAAALNPPAGQLAGRESIIERHAENPAFGAFAATDDDGKLVGFGYGFRGEPGQWWHDVVASGLGPHAAERWLRDSFEVAELHVLPGYQGRGIGRELLMRLTAERTERTAMLSTPDSESRARRLYRHAGFADLLTAFTFDAAGPPYAVMGAELPLRSERLASPSA